MKHASFGMVVFFVLAIFTVALDFLNQAIKLVEIQAFVRQAQTEHQRSSGEKTEIDKTIKVTPIVRYTLQGIEYFLLFVDTVFVVFTISNSMVRYLRSLTWKKTL